MIADGIRGLSVSRRGGGRPAGGSWGLWGRLLGELVPAVRLPFAPGEAVAGSMVSLAELSLRGSLAVVFFRGVASGQHDRMGVGGGSVEDARLGGVAGA